MRCHFSCSSLSLPPLSRLLDTLIDYFDGWQIVAEGKHEMHVLSDEFKDIAGSYNLKYSAHLPVSDINIASLNRSIRSLSISESAETMRLGADMGIRTFVVHPGTHSILSSQDSERAFLLAREGIRTLAALSKSLGTQLLVENTPSVSGSVAPSAGAMNALLTGLPVNMCLDVAHASLDGELAAFFSMSSRTGMIHLSDNDGHKDSHLQLGTGKASGIDVLSPIMKSEIPIVIEARSVEEAISGAAFVASLP